MYIEKFISIRRQTEYFLAYRVLRRLRSNKLYLHLASNPRVAAEQTDDKEINEQTSTYNKLTKLMGLNVMHVVKRQGVSVPTMYVSIIMTLL